MSVGKLIMIMIKIPVKPGTALHTGSADDSIQNLDKIKSWVKKIIINFIKKFKTIYRISINYKRR